MNNMNSINNVFSLMNRMGMINENVYHKMSDSSRVISLNEAMTIEKAQQTFSNISPEAIQTLLQIDPTYKGGNNVGKLFTWVANAYMRDPSIIENPEETKNLLTIFKDNQNRFTQQANIKQFQSISQLKQFLSQEGMLGNNQSNEIIDSIDNAEVRNGTNVVHNGDRWLIIVPENYAADRHWGANTSWCTAADNDGYYYDMYLSNYGGRYYILINKQYDNDKYQFHFESNQFMDAGDNQIGNDVYDLPDFEELNEFFSEEYGDDWAGRVADQGEEEEETFTCIREIDRNNYVWKYLDEDNFVITDNDVYAPSLDDNLLWFSEVSDYDDQDIIRVQMSSENNDGNEGMYAYWSTGNQELVTISGVKYFSEADDYFSDDTAEIECEYGTTIIDGYGKNILGDFYDKIDWCFNHYYTYNTGYLIVTNGDKQNVADDEGNWLFTEEWPEVVLYDDMNDWFIAGFDDGYQLFDKDLNHVTGGTESGEDIVVFDQAFFPRVSVKGELVAYVKKGEQWYYIGNGWNLYETELPERYRQK